MSVIEQLHCEVCGMPSSRRPVTLTLQSNARAEARCDLCQGLIDSNLIRPEVVDGDLRYRQWHITWEPGDLLPRVPRFGETAPESHSGAAA